MENSATTFPRARVANLVTKEIPDEVLVYDLSHHQAHCLNQTAALVWKYCDGATSVAAIQQELTQELNAPISEEVVWLALEQLSRSRLLETPLAKPGLLTNRSRRQTLRRLAGIALAPVITSIIAPIAQAGNTCLGQPCTIDSQCDCSTCCNTTIGSCAQAAVLTPDAPCAVPCQCLSGDCSGTPKKCVDATP